MIIQTLFDRMMLYDNQLDLIAGGDDVTRGITALNLVQDWYELAAAAEADLHQTASTFTTTASVETTTWPASLLRLDALWLLDSAGNQTRKLFRIDGVGDHRPGYPWLWLADMSVATVISGSPYEYYPQQQGGLLYWNPTPSAVYTIRGYGLWAAADYTAAANTFLYPDTVALTLVPHAVAVIRTGLNRDTSGQQAAATAAFKRLLKTFTKADHSEAQSRVYSEMHES